jgi:cupin 2 domain-containing protein
LLRHKNIKIERIVSQGLASPKNGWYDQTQNEWVIVLEGSGSILFESGEEVNLKKGDYLNIPAHTKHKVTRTDLNNITIWLAIHYW